MSTTGHRPGPFKLINKKHKSGRHRTKGSVSSAARGRVSVKLQTRLLKKDHNKFVRRHQANQLRIHKRHQLIDANRSIGNPNAPIFSTVISLVEDYPASEFIGLLCSCDSEASCSSSNKGYVNQIWSPRFKRHYQFVSPGLNYLDEVLRLTIASDIVVFLWPLSGEVSEDMIALMNLLSCHGLPTTVHFLPGLGALTKPKLKENAKKSAKKLMDKWSFGDFKLLNCDNDTDGLAALRVLSEVKKKPTVLQRRHTYVICENSDLSDVTENGSCKLKLTGFVRGPPLSVNRLIHLQGYGDYQLKEISIEANPTQMKKHVGVLKNDVLTPNPELQMSLVSENVPDPMEGEQTWPDNDELPKDAFATRKIKKKVPVGTSTYQAAWIVDDEEEEIESVKEGSASSASDVDDEENDEKMEFKAGKEEVSDDEAIRVEMVDNDTESVATEEFEDEDIDMSLVEKFRKERTDAQFPDEIDTPVDTPARIRFQRYRGLKSFRTSPWDPAENLPLSYARIFKFADYKYSRKLALSAAHIEDEYTASSGSYVTLVVDNVPTNVAKTFKENLGMIVYSLLPHEQKMTVLNMVLKKSTACRVPIANKEKLFFYVGYRRFEAQPIFSQHTNGDKFKMERFMPAKGAFIASVFAPVMFPPAPVLVFREDAKGNLQFVASGGVLNLNPDRIVLKRVVLSGHPFRISRHRVVARYMFFNREDIEWFKPVELYTPRGRRGNITEPLGTHGYMKCVFNQPLNAMESVMLNLYKRVYPKWTYNPAVSEKIYSNFSGNEKMEM